MEKENIKGTLPQPNPMCGGDGPHSYVHNSSYQKAAIDCVKIKIKDVISEKLDLYGDHLDLKAFNIVDFGCSVGPNTFDVVQNIIDTVKLKYQQYHNGNNHKNMEFHVFFNDQTNNDFNTLFKSLSTSDFRNYFVAGVPGSFYDRVLPRNTVNIGHTSYTLHWLSKVPQDISNRDSLGWTIDNNICSDLVDEFSKGNKGQFEKDMEAFLKARAEELVPGGIMFMSGMCLPEGVSMASTWMGVATNMIGDCLIDMNKSGILGKESIDSFHLPLYFPYMTELKEMIGQNGGFSIEVMERVIHPMEDKPLSNEFVTSTFRAIFNGIIEEYFGEGVVDELFNRYAKKLETLPIDFNKLDKVIQYFIALKRNIY